MSLSYVSSKYFLPVSDLSSLSPHTAFHRAQYVHLSEVHLVHFCLPCLVPLVVYKNGHRCIYIEVKRCYVLVNSPLYHSATPLFIPDQFVYFEKSFLRNQNSYSCFSLVIFTMVNFSPPTYFYSMCSSYI